MKKKFIAIIAASLAVLTVAGMITGIVLTQRGDGKTPTDGASKLSHDEVFVKELFGTKIEDIIADPEWEENLVSTTENYVMVYSDAFDFAKEIGVGDGYSYLYYDEESHEIDMVVHNFVEYTNDKDSKSEIEDVVSNVEGKITALLGNASQPFMLLNSSGEFEDYSELSLDQMIDKVIEGNTVMYTLFEAGGLDYEMNIMFSDDTIYTMVWIAECAAHEGDGIE